MEHEFQKSSQQRQLIDRAEIADVLGRYAFGTDMRDWDMVASCFAEAIALDFTELDLWSEPVDSVSREVWVRTLEAFYSELPACHHLNTPVLYEFEGEHRCLVTAVLQARHWDPERTDGESIQEVVGYYRDEFAREPTGWKIRGMKEIVKFTTGNSSILDDCVKNMMVTLKKEIG